MAHNLITQVQRGQSVPTVHVQQAPPPAPPPQPSFFQRVFCCKKPAPAAAAVAQPARSVRDRTTAATYDALLPPILPAFHGRKCLVLDLDETLVHSSFKPVPNADFIIPVEIEDTVHQVYVLKRPGVDEFMKKNGPIVRGGGVHCVVGKICRSGIRST